MKKLLKVGIGTGTIQFILFVALFLNSCEMEPTSLPVERSEVSGIYLANYKAGLVESLELRPDSTYSYRFLSKDSLEFVIEDQWRFHYGMNRKDHPEVFLDNFMAPFPLYGMCYCDDCPSYLSHRDSSRYSYGISVFKDNKERLFLRRCGLEQCYVKIQ